MNNTVYLWEPAKRVADRNQHNVTSQVTPTPICSCTIAYIL